MFNFVIVGGGINGLQLAALLSNDGYKVLVLEKSGHLGGRAFVWEKEGFVVDYGIHLIRFGPESAIAATFRKMNYKIKFKKLGTSYLYHNGRRFVFPTSPTQFIMTNIMNPVEKLKGVPLLLRIKKIKDQWKDFLHIPVDRWLFDNGISGGLKLYFELVTASMLVCPFLEIASTGELLFNMAKVLKTGKSVMYPAGGWKPLFDFLVNKIEKNGEIRLNSKVTGIEFSKNKVAGVYVGNELIRADNVIINVPVQEMWNFLDEDFFPKEYVERTKKLIPTSGIVVDIGLSSRISSESGLIYTTGPVAFGMFTSNIEPSLAPDGKQLLTFFYPTPLSDMEDEEKRKMGESEILNKIYTIWDIESKIEWKRISHLRMVDGAQININQTRELRPGYKAPGFDNLFLVGDSLGAPGAGGDVGHESVHGAYRTITGSEV